jgi:altronate hydrolase
MPATSPRTLRLHPDDPVVVALRDLAPGDEVEGVALRDRVERGHKVAVRAIDAGNPLRKYGQIIGIASRAIDPGEHVHTHNLAFVSSPSDRSIGGDRRNVPPLPAAERATFQGIVRASGKVATRNYIGILPTVNCSATVARIIADQFRAPGALDQFANVDGVVALTHKTGCSAGATGEAIDLLRRTMAGYAEHPNFAAILLVSLGCEANQLSRLIEAEDLPVGDRIHTLTMQEEGGTRATVRKAVGQIREMLAEADKVERETVSASRIVLGLQCGGSDALSGITANPALGAASDSLVRNGGTSILSETPEIYGAEHMLLGRAQTIEVGKKLIDLLGWWETYTKKHDESLDANPSPGNKAGGITTILEKSLGAAAKGGTSDLVEVYRYAEPVTKQGFVFMDTPGYDPVSATGQVAGGANMLCFTTGRGSCYGCRPVPSIKLATNTPMYERMAEDMDVNCGEIADGTSTVEEMGERIFKLILDTASGKKTKSELLGYGDEEFAPWHMGATL